MIWNEKIALLEVGCPRAIRSLHEVSSAIAAALFGAALLTSTADAEAAGHANGLGEKGELIISADRLVPLFSYTRASVTDTQNNIQLESSRSGTGLSLLFGRDLSMAEDPGSMPINVHSIPRVAIDVTIIKHLTLGAAIAFGFGLGGSHDSEFIGPGGGVVKRSVDAPKATAIGLVPRVGYVIAR